VTPGAPRRGEGCGGEAGFSLVAVVAAMTIMLIMMGAAMPSWKYVVQNEREQELFFRGDQIASAIERFQKKNGGAPPANMEVLVKGKFLRKAYADPMVPDGKWRFIRAGEMAVARAGGIPGLPGAPGASPAPRPSPPSRTGRGPVGISMPFVGVASFSEKESLRLMNGQDHYDQWMFVAGRPRVLGRDVPVIPKGNAGVPSPGPGTKTPGQTK
jgi:type II secretory pathway pseudopilin PulG